MIYLNILFIGVIWVFILDISGFSYDIKKIISNFIGRGKPEDIIDKPFFCSLCMTFWTGLIYVLCVKEFTFFNIMYVLIIACSTTLIKDLYYLIFDTIQAVLEHLSRKVNRR